MYKVIEKFIDLNDDCHVYNVGDEYPRSGVTVSARRINELSTEKNKRGKRLIEASVVGTEEIVKAETSRKRKKR